ncbi:MAG: hypothetical protein JRD69_02020 [Deltaproteobacteria bacterium]|nr:hypothetical protein [Deltaproteobacteria bacterium]
MDRVEPPSDQTGEHGRLQLLGSSKRTPEIYNMTVGQKKLDKVMELWLILPDFGGGTSMEVSRGCF